MPHSVKLSWQTGAVRSGRAGWWRKKYKGKVYYFNGGRGKSDRDAYDAALTAWENCKGEIDATTPRKHQRDYEAAIDQWEQVLAWSHGYGDKEHADQAAEKLGNLRRRFAAPKLTPLTHADWFEANFELPIDEKWLKDFTLPRLLGLASPDNLQQLDAPPLPVHVAVALGLELPAEPVVITPTQKEIDYLDGSPRRIEREIWRDRLAVMKQQACLTMKVFTHFVRNTLAGRKKTEVLVRSASDESARPRCI